ncbi:hypothetical protein [Gloeothece verrucosa]|uniref:Uncharacterized protein n=1 Tax=Gloeothece verrucosa (strain PCC 7822) TaxID=497965 RepID=E0UI81_GLOV7|nr:hypothetical protein [Gloeothece verrucosa]ADN15733.1 hypothetical protein Cyan7822_3798 [Gloeothece verrucosa PCC 7822]
MSKPNNDFDNNEFLNSLSPASDVEKDFSIAEVEAIKKKARRWFIILLVIGLTLGGILAVGIVKVLNELGLTKKPDHPIFKIESK